MKKTTIHRVGKRKPDNTNFNLFLALLVACVVTACSVATFAQSAYVVDNFGNVKPMKIGQDGFIAQTPADDTKDKSKAPPAEVTLAADTVRNLQDGAKDARIAQLEYENLAREIKLAEARLKDLLDAAKRAQDSSNAAFRAACVKAGIPASEVDQYEGTAQPDGSLTLKRKVVTAAK